MKFTAAFVGLTLFTLVFSASVVLAQTNPIPTAVVQARALGSSVELEGSIEAVRQSTLSAQTSGRIATLPVKAGDKVHAGQVLATIDDRETAAGVQRSQAQINQADAELRNAKANLERTRELRQKGFVSQAALDTAQAQFDSASAARAQASAAAVQSGLAQGFTRVLAPYDGWVAQTQAQVGDLAVPGKPLLTLYAPLPLRAVVQVPASRQSAVRAATRTQISSDGTHWLAPHTRTALPVADAVAQTTEWRLDLADKDGASLAPGQQVRVRFAQEADTTAAAARLLVPRAAIVRRGELTAVYVQNKDVFALRAVRLGADQGEAGVEVLAGLRGGEVVALDPIRAGMAQNK